MVRITFFLQQYKKLHYGEKVRLQKGIILPIQKLASYFLEPNFVIQNILQKTVCLVMTTSYLYCTIDIFFEKTTFENQNLK